MSSDFSEETCTDHQGEVKCKSLGSAISDIIKRNNVFSHTVVIVTKKQKTLNDTLLLHNSFVGGGTINVVCSQLCVFTTTLLFVARQHHSNFSIVFRNLTFSNSQLFLQNLKVQFIDVTFENSTLRDVSPLPGELGELQLLFSKVKFVPSNEGESFPGIYILNTQVTLIEFYHSSTLFSDIYANVSFLSFTSHGTQYESSMLTLSCATFCLCLFENSHLTEGKERKLEEPSLIITARMISCTLLSSHIINNTGGVMFIKSNAGLLLSWLQVSIQKCVFESNVKSGSGGALDILYFVPGTDRSAESFLDIVDSSFFENVAKQVRFVQSFGGAVRVRSRLSELGSSMRHFSLQIKNSTFVNNMADSGGGAIFVSPEYTSVTISDSLFMFTQETNHTFGGIFLVTFTSTSVLNTTFQSKIRNNTASLIELQMQNPGEEVRQLSVHTHCLPWMKLDTSTGYSISPATGQAILQKVVVSCASCPTSLYIDSDGKSFLSYKVHTNQSEIILYDSKGDLLQQECKDCPTGADCPGNDLISKPNFCGFLTDQGIEFLQCPMEYCCTRRPCVGFDQCSGNREGPLCGACKEGYALSMLSNNCVKSSDCNDHWLWFAALVGMCAYMLWYTFKNDLFALPSKLIKLFQKSNSADSQASQTDKQYFSILTFFVQASVVMRLTSFQQSARKVDLVVQKIESYFGLALSIEISYVSTNVCAVVDMTTTNKVMLKLLFLLGIYGMWCIAFCLASVLCLLLENKYPKGKSFLADLKIRLVYGLVKIIKYTYLGFTYVMFYSLSCITVNIGEDKTSEDLGTAVWFYDGSVHCYNSWQLSMILFGLTYIVPFPIVLYIGLQLLAKNVITGKSIIVGTFFPLPVLAYWVFNFLTMKRDAQSAPNNVSDDWDVRCREAIHDAFGGGYRQSRGGTQHWECVLMVRRFVLCATTLMPNPVIQLCVCVALCLVFLLHHAHVKPFVFSLSNKAETLSLTLLVGIAFINFGKSIFLYLGVNPQGSQINVMLNLGLLENMSVFFLLCYIVFGEIVLKMKHFVASRRKVSAPKDQPASDLGFEVGTDALKQQI